MTAVEPAPLRIVRLTVEGFKRIEVADITPPDTGVVVVSGKNGQGKSSLLDAISTALGGKWENAKVNTPIQDGRERSVVVADLGELVVTRKWDAENPKKSFLTVTDRNGNRRTQPQTLLNTLLGRLSFDPYAFLQLPPAKQRDLLLQVVDLDVDVDALYQERRDAYETRTAVGRMVDRLTGQYESMPEPAPGTPAHEVSASELVQEIREAETHNHGVQRARAAVATHTERIKALEEELNFVRFQLAEAEEEASADVIDTAQMEARLRNAETINAQVRSAAARESVRAELEDRRTEYASYTERIARIDRTKADAIASASLPVEGVDVDENGITYNSVPLADVNTAMRLRIAVAIAMALNPTIRIIRISDGSLLDSENMAVLEELAQDKGYQVWIERVDESGDVGIVIEDGEIKQNHYAIA